MGFLGRPLWLRAGFSVAAEEFGDGPGIQPFLRTLPAVPLSNPIFRASKHMRAVIGIDITVIIAIVIVVTDPVESGRHVNSP